MSYIQFESSRVKNAEREALREAREKILIDAEAGHNRKRAHAEKAKERGDDKWMLPTVEAKFSSDLEKKKKKKGKKEKKAKKSKKKRKKRSKSSSASDSSEDEEEEWVEKSGKNSVECNSPKLEKIQLEKPLERDEWMNLPGSFLCSAQEKKQKIKNDTKTKTCILTQPGQSSKELNPYWKDGGTGLPETEEKKPQLMDATWLKKSLQRAKEQAAEERRSLEEIASERWGSLAAINSLIEQSEKNSRRMYDSLKHSTNQTFSRNSYSERHNDYSKSRKNNEAQFNERRVTIDAEIGDGSNRRERERSASRDRTRRKSRDRINDRQSFSDRKKLAFRKPDDHEISSSSCSNKSSSVAKRWQKSKANEKTTTDQSDDKSREAKIRSKKLKKSNSDQSDSSNDEKFKANEKITKNRRDTNSREEKIRSKKSKTSDSDQSDSSSDEKSKANERITKDQRNKNLREAKIHSKKSKKSDSDESDSSNDEKEIGHNSKIETDKTLTDAELNRLGAMIVKAEIMGDTELAISLKTKLETARELRKNRRTIVDNKSILVEENVILTKINSKGMARPLEPRSQFTEPTGGRRKAKKVGTHESGQRVRYFADDDKFTLQEMFQREKGQTSSENDATFVKMASKSMDMDELFEQRITREESDAKLDERERTRAIADHQKQASIMANCNWCFDSKKLLKHMIVAMGEKCYVSLPPHASLTTGHCVLTPVQHVSCQTQLDEDVWEELQNFKKAITKMFMDKNEFPVFFELFSGQHRYPHMQLECVPLPDEVGSMAPIYFKKALLECEMEWSTNKKVVDLSTKNVRESIPKGLPYFAVNFGNHGGFAHVIEDEKLFPRNFAQEIIGGILDLDHNLWRKPRRENFDQQRKKVLEFAAAWKSYDFTVNDESR